MSESASTSGTLPSTIILASPSAIAVLPTPASPTNRGIVLPPSAQYLDRALDLVTAPDEGVNLPEQREVIEVGGIRLQRALRARFARFLVVARSESVVAVVVVDLGDSVRNVIDDVEAGHVLSIEQVHRLGLALAENRDEHVGAGDLLLAGGLHVEHRALEHALKPERGLRFALILRRKHRGVLVEIPLERPAQRVDVDAAGAQHLARFRVVDQREQQMLDGHEFMPLFAGAAKRGVESVFQLLAQHDVGPLRRITRVPSYTEVDDCSRARSRSPGRLSFPRYRAHSTRTPPFPGYARAA